MNSTPWSARLSRLYSGTGGERTRFILFVGLLGLLAFCGGSSRPDAWQLLILRPFIILLATAILMQGAPLARSLRRPGLLLAALALVMILQLVPLPSQVWGILPGHATYLEAAAATGTSQPWRPITVSVDLTLNSLLALAAPAALLLGAAALRPDQRTASAGFIVGVAVLSAFLGLLQVTLGPSFYLYALTNVGRPVGLFANINHQAAFLAASIPVAAAWTVGYREVTPVRIVAGGAAGVLLLATILVSGSRSGIPLAALAVLSVPLVIGDSLNLTRRAKWLTAAGAAAATTALIIVIWLAGRLDGLDRLLSGSATDQRVAYLPITTKLLRDYSPFGSGFGTFDAVFRQVEPDAALKLTYFNHAHNDLLELGITGGLGALIVALVYIAWLFRRGVAVFGAGGRKFTAPLTRAGLFAVALLLMASLADYPLRTPLAAAMLALASLWVAEPPDLGAGRTVAPGKRKR